MKFSRLSEYFSQIEKTTKRLEITDILAKLFKEAPAEEAGKICYLVLGRLAPSYEAIEFFLAEKMLIRVLVKAYDVDEEEVRRRYKKSGDLGDVAQELAKSKKQKAIGVGEVYHELRRVAEAAGAGSQEKKVSLMAELLRSLDPLSAKYVVRIPLGKLRLGFSDKTILDALSVAEVGDKSLRPVLERAYNISADIGRIAEIAKSKGTAGLKTIKVTVGTPVRMAAAERLPTPKEILEKMGGKLAAEPKYDGFRVQVHCGADKEKPCQIFSRNLESTTLMFPEIVTAARKLPAKNLILEGEAIAYNPETEEFEPFQETAKRKRKYGIAEKAASLPLKVFAFDLLYLDGTDLTQKPYEERRTALENLIKADQAKAAEEVIIVAEEKIFTDAKKLEKYFLEQIEHGLEGIMTKKLDGVYQAGVRNFNWVKLKRVEKGKLEDTIDCVVLGYYSGRGKRAGFGIGGFLVGVYDDKSDTFKTISRVGSGLTDEEWGEMKRRVDALGTKEKPKNVDVEDHLNPDVWAQPAIVVAIRADEITRSPMHTAGRRGDEPGLALRFPRLMAFRDDKTPEQATTVEEVETLYKQQRKR